MASACAFLILFVFLLIRGSVGQTGHDLKTLYTELFTTRAYNKNIPPHGKLAAPIKVNITFFLQGINSLDEVEEKLATTANIKLEWRDAFLTWDRNAFSDISYFYITQDEVWKPDISLLNGFSKLKELGDHVILVTVNSIGNVVWNPMEVFETKCDIDITKFPFDKQLCRVVFKMWAYKPQDVSLALTDRPLLTDIYEENGVWDLSNATITLFQDNIIISLRLERKPQYYVLTVICPIVLLSLLDIFTFVIPADSGEKIGYSMTVLLSFAVLLTIVSSSLPVNSRTSSYLAVYVISLMIKGTAIVMVTVAQVRLHHRPDSKEPSPMYKFIITVGCKMNICNTRQMKPDRVDEIVKVDNTCHSSQNVAIGNKCPQFTEPSSDSRCGNSEDGNDDYTWQNVSKFLDVFFFFFFSVVDVILFCVFFKTILCKC
ncbi:acetylcholine receptor subunit beta-like [Argopecten irradians]|uniref:acetylcholine receptor subunit beta-like n=1 Tax=Argopecten irradians TaxID=31199 RepID=UPI00371F9879